jgi:hypothetical protein
MPKTTSETKQRRRYLSAKRVALRVLKTNHFIFILCWRTVAEVELDDVACPAAAGDAAPPAAVVVSLPP